MSNDIPPERPTGMACPVKACEGGRIVLIEENRTRYKAVPHTCTYCDGTGIVTPARHAAYKFLRKGMSHE